MFATVGRIDHTEDSNEFANRILRDYEPSAGEQLLTALLEDAGPRENASIFAPSAPESNTALSQLDKFLGRQGELNLVARGDDLTLAPLSYYTGSVYRSSAAILPLLSEGAASARTHNARASFLAGFAVGQEIPTLLLAPKSLNPPLDYKDRMFRFGSAVELTSKIEAWIQNLQKDPSDRRVGRLRVSVEMPISTFGRYVAEEELDALSDYYVPTVQFENILSGSFSTLFLGRKGTGKSAAMEQATRVLSRETGVLTVALKPASYEIQGMLQAAESMSTSSELSYFFINLWRHLLYTEIAFSAIEAVRSQPSSVEAIGQVEDLESFLVSMNVDPQADFSARMETLIERLTLGESTTINQAAIAESLKVSNLARILTLTKRILAPQSRVSVLIDNLDKAWEPDSELTDVSRFLLSLIDASRDLERKFAQSRSGEPSVTFNTTIFLRQDIFDAIRKRVAEPDKLPIETIEWRDQELLIRVLEERYLAKRRGGRSKSGDVWKELFPQEVNGLSARDYFLWRSLPRPRDLIHFANLCLSTAINRNHSLVTQDDVATAESVYSRFAVDALIVESASEGMPVQETVLNLGGLESTILASDISVIFSELSSPDDMLEWLIRTSFLGVEVGPGEFRHVEGSAEARTHMALASRFATKRGAEPRYRIHPAFRPHLQIRDDDLHDGLVTDVTLGYPEVSHSNP
ncbi:hypothetical protein M3F63_03710 [Brachybacterium muris]|uniref:P-loop ATPase, Sll1717 family n=3 Tax=Brachybacterium muris TaxID=219301 RepID=UPI00223B6B8C|nr:hypothetical protein [Brachybacterium muris]MCT2176775.1 hypothetical protein [Brachybacterium muris]